MAMLLLMLVTLDSTSAWFGGGGGKDKSGSTERSFTDRVMDTARAIGRKVADAGRFAAGAAKGTGSMAKAYK